MNDDLPQVREGVLPHTLPLDLLTLHWPHFDADNVDVQYGTAVAAVGIGVDEGECQVILNVGFEDIAHGWCDVSTQSRELGWEKSGWQ